MNVIFKNENQLIMKEEFSIMCVIKKILLHNYYYIKKKIQHLRFFVL